MKYTIDKETIFKMVVGGLAILFVGVLISSGLFGLATRSVSPISRILMFSLAVIMMLSTFTYIFYYDYYIVYMDNRYIKDEDPIKGV